MTRPRSAIALLDAARDLAIHRGLAVECAWYLCTHPGGGASAWLYVDADQDADGVTEEVCLLDDVDIHETPEEAAQALLEWVEQRQPDLEHDVSWS